ncbi:hypothetical protein BDR06DRAFT_1020478 [Suillus hirtellus]|nr:hypothetical protein BDR06DRAFT_1020478 [Suillus hirtellus]
MSYVSEVADLQISKYTNIGSLAILVFDYCITFQDEVRWTWSRPWGLIRVVFTISRYLPFVGSGLTAYAALRVGGPCPPSLAENIIHILSIVAAEVILALTAYKWFRDYRDSEIQSSIVTTVYGGSMLYMLCIIAITVTNVVVDAAFPVGFTNLFDTLQLVIHSVLASRILFHLRSSDSHAHETDIPLMVSAPRYGQPSQMQTNEIKDETNEV